MKRLKSVSIKPLALECIMKTKRYMIEISVLSNYALEVELPHDANLEDNVSDIQDEIYGEFANGSEIILDLKDENGEEFTIEIESIDDLYPDASEVRTVTFEDMA